MRRALVVIGLAVAMALIGSAIAISVRDGASSGDVSTRSRDEVPSSRRATRRRPGARFPETVRGRVEVSGGAPARGAHVWVDGIETSTDDDGCFAVPDRPRGTHRVVISAEGRLAEEHVMGPGAAPLRVRLHRPIVREGTLALPDGVPREGVEIEFQLRHGGVDQKVRTDADGRFRADRLRPYGHYVRFRSQRVGDRAFFRTSVLAPRFGREPVLIEPTAGAVIEGVVRAPDGTPVAGARVQARGRWPRSDTNHLALATSGAGGRFEVIVPAGVETTLIASAPGNDGRGDRFAASSTSGIEPPSSDVELRLKAGHAVSGIVLDAAGVVLAGAKLDLRCGRDGRSWVPTVHARTDHRGRFVANGLLDERVRITLAAEEQVARSLLLREEIDAPAEDVTLRAVRALVVRARIVRGGELAGRSLQYALARDGERVDAWRWLSPSGGFEVGRKPPGEYEVRVRLAGDDVRTCGVVTAGAAPVELAIPPRR